MREKNWNHCSNYQLACTKNLALTHFLSLSSYFFLNFRMAGSACDAGVKAIDEQLFRAIERKRVRKDTEKLGGGVPGAANQSEAENDFCRETNPDAVAQWRQQLFHRLLRYHRISMNEFSNTHPSMGG